MNNGFSSASIVVSREESVIEEWWRQLLLTTVGKYLSTHAGEEKQNNGVNIPGSYKVLPRPHFGQADHVSLLLLPTYSQPIHRCKLLKCGQTRLQQPLRSFMNAQAGRCSVSRNIFSDTVRLFPNQKTWMDEEVRDLFQNQKKKLGEVTRMHTSMASNSWHCPCV